MEATGAEVARGVLCSRVSRGCVAASSASASPSSGTGGTPSRHGAPPRPNRRSPSGPGLSAGDTTGSAAARGDAADAVGDGGMAAAGTAGRG